MVLPYINMNLPRVYTCSQSWTPSHLPPHTIPLGHPSAPAPSFLYPASNLDWWFISYMILYMFQCHSPKSSHPLPFPQYLLLSRAWGLTWFLGWCSRDDDELEWVILRSWEKLWSLGTLVYFNINVYLSYVRSKPSLGPLFLQSIWYIWLLLFSHFIMSDFLSPHGL